MKSTRILTVIVLLISSFAFAQTKIVIPAGTPEDKALNDINQESAVEKKTAMLEEFVQKFSESKPAVAYGNWQLSQLVSGSDPAKALDYGDKALAAMPDVLDILQSQTDLAQQGKAYSKVVDYATRGAVVIGNIPKLPKPAEMDEESWKGNLAHEQELAQPIYDYMATAAYNAMANEPDAKKRVTEIERFLTVFASSKLAENATVLAVATYQETNDFPKLVAYGEKAIAADPKNVSLMTVMANAFAEDPKGAELGKATMYATKAIELAKADKTSPEENRLITEGFAHQVLGYALLRQEKTPAAIAELKTASAMLKSDPAKYSITLYRLGFAYAKSNQVANAKQVLTEATTVQGPFKDAAKDLLVKVNAAKPRK
jgi:tetratricopeptide (TPR) repeat protein